MFQPLVCALRQVLDIDFAQSFEEVGVIKATETVLIGLWFIKHDHARFQSHEDVFLFLRVNLINCLLNVRFRNLAKRLERMVESLVSHIFCFIIIIFNTLVDGVLGFWGF